MRSRTPHRSSTQRGFTLVEMMVVVVIVGVLAALAVYGVRKYILSAKVGEAVSMMGSIKSAEEAFKGETFIYLDVSSTFDPPNFYPTATPGRSKVQWGAGSTPVAAGWRTLGVHPDGPVAFSYAVVATKPGAAQPTLPTDKTDFKLPTTITNWQYVAVAKADLNGDGSRYTYVLSHSYSSEIYIENEGE